MSLFLCLDCGGTKTTAVVSDLSGTILARSQRGPSNFATLGLPAFSAAVGQTIADALSAIPHPASFSAAWFGIAGVDSPAAIAALIPSLSSLTSIPQGPHLIVTNDAALLAAPFALNTDVAHCVTCVAGTGATCISFNRLDPDPNSKPESRPLLPYTMMARMGGWGWILGNEGSGFHVGRETLRQLLTEADMSSLGAISHHGLNHDPTLKTRVLLHFGVTHVHEILGVLYLPDPSPSNSSSSIDVDTMTREKRLSSLCPLVFSSAFDDGDPLALNILCTCADDLASQISLLLSPPGTTLESLPRAVKAKDSIISFGGSLVAIDAYRKMVLDSLAERGHVFKDVQVIKDPATAGVAALAHAFSKQGATTAASRH